MRLIAVLPVGRDAHSNIEFQPKCVITNQCNIVSYLSANIIIIYTIKYYFIDFVTGFVGIFMLHID